MYVSMYVSHCDKDISCHNNVPHNSPKNPSNYMNTKNCRAKMFKKISVKSQHHNTKCLDFGNNSCLLNNPVSRNCQNFSSNHKMIQNTSFYFQTFLFLQFNVWVSFKQANKIYTFCCQKTNCCKTITFLEPTHYHVRT